MMQQSGVQWDVQAFDTGHSPFLSQPDELTAWTINEVSKFATDTDSVNATTIAGDSVSNATRIKSERHNSA